MAFLLYAPGFVLAGLAMGFQFPGKGFMWGFIVSLPAILLIPEIVAFPLWFSIVSGQSGLLANSMLEARLPDAGAKSRLIRNFFILAMLLFAGYWFTRSGK
jgi:hypothetical protein